MTIYFTNRNDFKVIHVFSDCPKGWIPEPNGIDSCSNCGINSFHPVIRKDIFSLMTKRRSSMCRVNEP